ncbi:hypothetical protein BJ741DRAFT_713757 [Chytriomyces cf. hyalinus JEL632]|nr:hypothetical protein BJ741DRAFT_713757 [Chytriomyces cf. hyalinus JEL632]
MSNQQHPMNYSLMSSVEQPEYNSDDNNLSLALLLDRRFSMPNPSFSMDHHQHFQSPQQLQSDTLQISDFSRRMSFQPILMTDVLTVSPVASPAPLNAHLSEYNRRMPYAMYHHPGDVPSSRTGSPVNVFSSLHSQQEQQHQDVDLFDLHSYSFPSSPPQKDLSSPSASYMFPPILQQQQQQGKNVDIAMFNQHMLNSTAAIESGFYQFPSFTSASAPVSPLFSAMPLLEDKICSFEEAQQQQTPHQKPATPAAATPLKMNPSLATTRFFGKEPEPGLDILMASPPTSPATLIHARRHSVATDLTRPARFKPTEAELVMLTAIFQKNPFPSAALRQKLADKMGLDIKQVQFWFQNRRATMKISGIHVLKPKRGNSVSLNGDKKRASLSPLSSDSPYFYVKDGGAVMSKPQPIPLQF